MKVALIGATGRVGSRLMEELLRRGHRVTGIVRNPGQREPREGSTFMQGNIDDDTRLATLLQGHDVVIHSVPFVNTDEHKLIAALKRSGVKRLLVVGGAGSLEVAPGRVLVDTPEFPTAYKKEALAGREFLNELRQEKDIDWTFISPSALFEPGPRTGKFRLGKNQLLVGPDGQSRITMEDYSIGFVDELEQAHHKRERMTVGY